MKIHICGIYGCGKSTLAKILSKKLDISCYLLDDIKYKVKYTEIRSVEEGIEKVRDICKNSSWITEGIWTNYAKEAFKKSDIIIFMQTPKIICCFRILKRFFLRKKEKGDTLIGALKLIKKVYKYHSKDETVSEKAHKEIINKYKKTTINN
ncbi:MAG: hypothetical protein KKH88_01920 [Nanoarchaeota archaeon]|nr:hypothetical protein [Nanoarchaeota archaeon]